MSYWQAYKKVASTNLMVLGLVLVVALAVTAFSPKIRREVESFINKL